MKIKQIRAAGVNLRPPMKTEPRVPPIPDAGHFTSPMARYETEFADRSWSGSWSRAACVVTADNGAWGLGLAPMGGPVLSIVNDHFAPLLEGQDTMAVEKHWDLMRRASSPYGTHGLTSYAISAVDNALWDLKGKLLGRPVYELLGGPVKDRIFCYASNTMLTYGTESYIDWFLELGFKAVKLFVRHGPEDGIEGLRKNEELVARTREQVGPDVEIAVDSWMSLNVEYIVRLVEALKPYRIKWLEDYLLPEDMDSYFKVRQRVPGQTLATGEHWYTIHPFALAAGQGLVDILQPDVAWGRWGYGQRPHMPHCGGARRHGNRARWNELSVRTAPGLRDARDPLGRAFGGGLPTRRSSGGDGAVARHTRHRGWVRGAKRRSRVRHRGGSRLAGREDSLARHTITPRWRISATSSGEHPRMSVNTWSVCSEYRGALVTLLASSDSLIGMPIMR